MPSNALRREHHAPSGVPAANNEASALVLRGTTNARPRLTSAGATANATLIETLRAIVRDIVREEMAVARPATSDATSHLSTRAAAIHAGVAMGTIRRWIRDGKLREHRAGRHLRVRRTDLEALLAGHHVGPDASPEELAQQAFGG